MFEFKLRPEMRKQLKDPDRFVKGQEMVHWGIIIAMAGVVMSGILIFQDPEKSTHPVWLMILGLLVSGVGEFHKYRSK